MKTILFLALLVIGLSFLTQNVFADDVSWDGGGDGSSWSDPDNWDNDEVPQSGDDITIEDAEVVVDINVVIAGSLTLNDGTILAIEQSFDNSGYIENNGQLSVSEFGTFTNSGTIDNYAGFEVDGFMTITSSGIFNNNENGSFDNNDQGTTHNHGEINNFEAINNYGIFINFSDGTITIASGATLTDGGGSFTNDGSIVNNGEIILDCDGISGSGTISGSGSTTVDCSEDLPPVITTPGNISVEAVNPAGTSVTYVVTANDPEDGPVSVICVPSSGSSFIVGTHTITCTATDSGGNITIEKFLVIITDTTPPIISVPANITQEALGPLGNVVTYTVSATDNGDPSVSPLCIPASGQTFPIGVTTVNCTATDDFGNSSTDSFLISIIDTTAPNSPIINSPTGLINDNTPLIEGTAEPLSTVTITIDGTIEVTTTAGPLGTWSVASPALSEGGHSATATATDLFNNQSGPSNIISFTIDSIPPETTITSGPTGTVDSSSAAFDFESDESNSTFECSLDSSPFQSCTSPVTYSGLGDGNHTFEVRATDEAGNTDPTPASQTWIADTSTPTPIITSPTDGSTTTDNTPLISGTAEADSTVTVTIDGTIVLTTTANSSGSWSVTSPELSNGSHTVSATAEDTLGHISPPSTLITFTISVPSANVALSGIIRDFKISHPDFEYVISDDDGIVKNTLGIDKNPLYNGNPTTVTTTGIVNFNQWYNHVNSVNQCTTYDITLTRDDDFIYSFSDSTFFPIDGQLFGNEGKLHNYHFTYEVHATFTYQPGQTITLTGDDDIWVFIDNRLALDQGGVLPPRTGTINLDDPLLGLVAGQTYNFDLFFAERHTSQSSLGVTTNIEFTPITPPQCDLIDAVDDSVFATQGPNSIPVTNNDVGQFSIFAFTQGMHGSVALVGTSLVYTPNIGFEGIDHFTYIITNIAGSTDTATVTAIALIDATCPLPVESYNIIIGDDGDNKLKGTNDDDLIIGNGGDDKIQGKKGNDCIVGGAGNDKIHGGDGDDTVIGGNGDDRIHGQKGDDALFGGNGDDRIYGGKGNDTIDAGAGNDRVHANQDNDVVTGGDGDDWLGAGNGNDTVSGGAGNDKIFGRQGNDILNGNDGDDIIHGGQGDDDIDGGAGNDKCNGAQGNNTILNCEVEDKKMKEEQEENDDDEGESEDDDDDDNDKDKKDKDK